MGHPSAVSLASAARSVHGDGPVGHPSVDFDASWPRSVARDGPVAHPSVVLHAFLPRSVRSDGPDAHPSVDLIRTQEARNAPVWLPGLSIFPPHAVPKGPYLTLHAFHLRSYAAGTKCAAHMQRSSKIVLDTQIPEWHSTSCTRRYLSWIEGLTTNQDVTGSNPVRRTTNSESPERGSYHMHRRRLRVHRHRPASAPD